MESDKANPANNPSSPSNPAPKQAAAPAPSGSDQLSPNDHLELLVELMRPGSVELARRWVSALMLAPASEREAIVQAVEAQMVEDYPEPDNTQSS